MSVHVTSTAPIAFVLGCERSGSTWVANILDAHAGVELMMEPFAPYAKFFPGLPERHVPVTRPSAAMEENVRRGLVSAIPAKYALSYRPGQPVSMRSMDATLIHNVHRVIKKLSGRSPLPIQRWELLNLNQSEIPAELRVRKQWPPDSFVVKELRLNLKVPLLHATFPDARYIVIVRNPAAQLTSTRNWLERGRLRELAGALKTLPDDLKQPELERYRRFLGSGDRDDLLVVWWFLNYETVVTDLRRVGARALMIRHEELAAHPAEGTAGMLSFLGLRASESVSRYVEHSSGAEQKTSSPVDTFRKSAEHSRETIRGADRALVAKLRRVAEELPCCEELRGYFVED